MRFKVLELRELVSPRKAFNSLYEIQELSEMVSESFSVVFQFSLWDSWDLKVYVWFYWTTYFQFSLWDSEVYGVMIGGAPYLTFNSLYEIQVGAVSVTSPLFFFQFSLWDSSLVLLWENNYILQVFQFSLWDSVFPDCVIPLITVWLSILFMRFKRE